MAEVPIATTFRELTPFIAVDVVRLALPMADAGRDPAGLAIAYQVTMNVAPTEAEARAGIDQYISQYYPEMTRNKTLDLDEWGPIGTPDRVARWIETLPRPASPPSSAASAPSINRRRWRSRERSAAALPPV